MNAAISEMRHLDLSVSCSEEARASNKRAVRLRDYKSRRCNMVVLNVNLHTRVRTTRYLSGRRVLLVQAKKLSSIRPFRLLGALNLDDVKIPVKEITF